MANYVNNKELYLEICDWKRRCALEPDSLVRMTDKIGEAIMLISEGLSKRFNFSGYTQSWKQEMIEDGIEAAIKGLKNFDETKYNNPHAYITQACFNAFVQRIKKERREVAKKYSYFVHNVYDARDDDMVALADETFIQDIYDKMTQYESSLVKVPGSDKALDLEDDNALDFLYEAQA
ncbi:late sigma transcription factor [Escherichia phage EcS1]|uniref:RNA polymerase sigma-like factor n=1 Tax=Escherichia phage EcS1 TaxID=2083276 RepID=A0A2Z5ZCB0_9CAUD|nr:late sigma transcription factor [Escherichia phage EcS1]BBC78107.1 Sigma factor for late transcription [Escherichia phage EcS1]